MSNNDEKTYETFSLSVKRRNGEDVKNGWRDRQTNSNKEDRNGGDNKDN